MDIISAAHKKRPVPPKEKPALAILPVAAEAELVRLRYFAGLTLDECAALLGMAPATAERWWAYTRVWLHAELIRDHASQKKLTSR